MSSFLILVVNVTFNYLSGNYGATDNKKLVEIFVNRDSNALKVVRQAYSSRYGQDLLQFMSNVMRNNSFSVSIRKLYI